MFDRLMLTNKAGGFGVGKTGFLQVLAFRHLSKLYLKRYIILFQYLVNSKIEIIQALHLELSFSLSCVRIKICTYVEIVC